MYNGLYISLNSHTTINYMIKGRKPLEFFSGERVYTISRGKSGRGDFYGICYLPKELIGKKIMIQILNKKDYKSIEIVKRKYSLKKKKLNRIERRLKKKK